MPKSVATLAILFIATTTYFILCTTTTAQQLHHTPVAVRALASCFALWCVLRRLRLAAIAVAGTVCSHFQEVVTMSVPEQEGSEVELHRLGQMQDRLVVTPNIDELLGLRR